MPNVTKITDIEIRDRPDLQIDRVALNYERTDQLNGKEYLALGYDYYPPGNDGSGLQALNATITLVGFSRTTVTADILCDDIDTTDVEFWKRVIPRLRHENVKNVQVIFRAKENPADPNVSSVERVLKGSRTAANREGTPSNEYPRRLVEGNLVDWMRDATDNQLDWDQEELSAEFSFDIDVDATGGVKLERVERARLTVELVSTNAPTGISSYSTTEAEEEGEVQPTGLAQYLYNALSGLDYEGGLAVTQNECTGFVGPGNVINVTETAIAAHASMRARVQSVDEQIDTGETSVRFGPTPALSLEAILEFMHATRHRRRWTRTEVQENGENAASGTVELGQATPNDSDHGQEKQRRLFACQFESNRVELDAAERTISIVTAGKVGLHVHSASDEDSSTVMLGGATGGVSREVQILTAGAAAVGLDGTKGRPVSLRMVQSCQANDPPGSKFARIVLCSARFAVDPGTVFQ